MAFLQFDGTDNFYNTGQQCLQPMPPQHGILEPLIRDIMDPNFNVTFKCRRGFEPSEQFTAICLNNGTWSPSPTNHVCTGDGKP